MPENHTGKPRTRRSETSGFAHREEFGSPAQLQAAVTPAASRAAPNADLGEPAAACGWGPLGLKRPSARSLDLRADVFEKSCPQRSLWLRWTQPRRASDRSGILAKSPGEARVGRGQGLRGRADGRTRSGAGRPGSHPTPVAVNTGYRRQAGSAGRAWQGWPAPTVHPSNPPFGDLRIRTAQSAASCGSPASPTRSTRPSRCSPH